jgi:Alr-MurF fusion protein
LISVSLNELSKIINGKVYGDGNEIVDNISIDSRRIKNKTIFFPLPGEHFDGHEFINNSFENGGTASVFSKNDYKKNEKMDYIKVDNILHALQQTGAWHRSLYKGKVVGITGSNGKTIIKNLLMDIFSLQFQPGGTIGSYNSQLGVPLAVLSMGLKKDFWFVEAGISQKNEMDNLKTIVQPDFGILTNIGKAHLSGFGSREVICSEKIKLFEDIPESGWVLLPDDEPLLKPLLSSLKCKIHLYGSNPDLPRVVDYEYLNNKIKISVLFPDGTKKGVLLNTLSMEIAKDFQVVICTAFLFGVTVENIIKGLNKFVPSSTRMEIWKSPQGVNLINDTCSSDPMSVQSALRTMNLVSKESQRRIFVFGGMGELGAENEKEHQYIGEVAASSGVDILFLPLKQSLDFSEKGFLDFSKTGEVIRYKSLTQLGTILREKIKPGDTVLFKGPRNEKITDLAFNMFEAIAPNRMVVDLQAISENINTFRRITKNKTLILAMVKALAYGSDMTRLSKELEKMGIDFLGVSTPDEGMRLRESGASLPILVMISTPEECNKIIKYHLTPVITSFEQIKALGEIACFKKNPIDIHLKVDSGMGRMGLTLESLKDAVLLANSYKPHINISGLMTHFSCADDPSKKEFNNNQLNKFSEAIKILDDAGIKNYIKHAAATSATIMLEKSHFDMVRIGLGLYGLYPETHMAEILDLNLAVSLVSRIIDIRIMNKGSKIGYSATYEIPYDNFKIGVVPLGYFDGIPWTLSNRGKVMVNGKLAPIIGRISMDSMLIDLNGIPQVEKSTDVLIYGKHGGFTYRPEQVAKDSGTIVYELLTRIGPRVQRIYKGL